MKKHTFAFAVLSAAACMTLMPTPINPVGTVWAAACGWTEEDGSMVYYDEDGELLTNTWRKEGNDWYYLGESGHITRNTKVDEYYVGDDGKMVKNTWMELSNEEDADSPEAPAAFWYYFGDDGKAAASRWLKHSNKWYYFNDAGQMLTGKVTIDGATYYLGDENDGTMKTGWVKMAENSSTPGVYESWFYFNSDGKMVETQYDKKIDGAYYTFIDGRMQTGWVEMPKNEASADTTATDSSATEADRSITNFQYYGKAGDGKRASGWQTIEGIEGIHDMDETFTFYFRSGKPLVSSSEGNELFTISGKKYAFNQRGEMQTGRQIVNIANGEIANFYFGDDGVMKTGKQTIYNENTNENETWFFYTEGDRKGQGFHGIRDNVLYIYGKRQDAASDMKYAAVDFNGTSYLVNTSGSIQKASSSSTSSVKPELGRGHKDFKDSNGKVWVVDLNGAVK